MAQAKARTVKISAAATSSANDSAQDSADSSKRGLRSIQKAARLRVARGTGIQRDAGKTA